MHIVRGLRQAAFMLVAAGVVAAAGAGLWTAWQGGEFARAFAVALVIVAGLLGVSSGSVIARGQSSHLRVLMGNGPDDEEMPTGDALTGVGVFLFVSIPLFLVGGFLYA